jgi:hypothetical protein
MKALNNWIKRVIKNNWINFILNELIHYKTITYIFILFASSCRPEPIREPGTIIPFELKDTIIDWERIMNNEPEIMYCLQGKNIRTCSISRGLYNFI